MTLFFKVVAISSTQQLVSSPAGRRSTSFSTLTDWSGLTAYRYLIILNSAIESNFLFYFDVLSSVHGKGTGVDL